jgi:hypothetical protein
VAQRRNPPQARSACHGLERQDVQRDVTLLQTLSGLRVFIRWDRGSRPARATSLGTGSTRHPNPDGQPRKELVSSERNATHPWLDMIAPPTNVPSTAPSLAKPTMASCSHSAQHPRLSESLAGSFNAVERNVAYGVWLAPERCSSSFMASNAPPISARSYLRTSAHRQESRPADKAVPQARGGFSHPNKKPPSAPNDATLTMAPRSLHLSCWGITTQRS